MATLRLVRAAERAGARRFVFFSAMGARHHSRTRFFRAKALAAGGGARRRRSRRRSSGPSIVYSPGRPLAHAARALLLPARRCPSRAPAGALYQPIWAEDVADCVVAALIGARGPRRRAFELAGPRDALLRRHRARGAGRAPAGAGRCCTCRCRSCGPRCGAAPARPGPKVFATWEEAELMEEPMTTPAARPTPRRSACGRCRWRRCWARPKRERPGECRAPRT